MSETYEIALCTDCLMIAANGAGTCNNGQRNIRQFATLRQARLCPQHLCNEGKLTMPDEMTVTTNNVPRDILDACELTLVEQTEFDYLDWSALEQGTDSATFFRYRGTLYDLGEFFTTSTLPEFSPLRKWDGYSSDTFFSGMLVRYANDWESVIVGRFYT